jgi:ribosome-associated protein
MATPKNTKKIKEAAEELGPEFNTQSTAFVFDRKVINSELIANLIKILDDGKLTDIVKYDAKNDSYVADYILIATGTSDRHVDGVAQKIVQYCKQQLGVVPHRDNGSKEWTSIDIGGLIMHIMTAEKRAYYTIDELMEKYASLNNSQI